MGGIKMPSWYGENCKQAIKKINTLRNAYFEAHQPESGATQENAQNNLQNQNKVATFVNEPKDMPAPMYQESGKLTEQQQKEKIDFIRSWTVKDANGNEVPSRGIKQLLGDGKKGPAKCLADLTMDDLRVLQRIYAGEKVSAEELFAMPIVKTAEAYAKDFGKHPPLLEDGVEPIGELLRHLQDVAQKFLDGAKGKTRGRRAAIITGIPSSGKSSAIATKLLKDLDAFEMDNDIIKGMLSPEHYAGGKGANQVQEASSYVSERLAMPALIKDGTNLVIPVVGKNKIRLEKK